MTALRLPLHGLWLGLLLSATATAEPPTCTTHFFDWYTVSDRSPLAEIQKRWTYQVDWRVLGIAPEDIGNTVHYYAVQCRRIKDAGFDGLHYEWHGNPVKRVFREALEQVNLPVAMFYDMEIRFSGQGPFIQPTEEFAQRFENDVADFYASVPRTLWLRDRHGRLPIIVYGYAFDTRVTDPAAWDRFYRAIIAGVEERLGEQVVFHWTNNGSIQQLYGFQHFPEIQSYVFNEMNQQSPVNAQSVTFVVHYDDLGVSFARGGPRASRGIRNDIRYLQEALWLAEQTDPDLVFNYGWNELYEGEHLLPDSLWGDWRWEVAAAMVRAVKTTKLADETSGAARLPRALVIADDFLPRLHEASTEQAAQLLRREAQLLTRLRSLVPRADVVLPRHDRDLADYDVIFSLNMQKDADEDAALAACRQPVIYCHPNADGDTAMTRRFTDLPREPLPRAIAGPENEYVVIQRDVDIDLTQFPLLQYRCRNTRDTLFHIRYRGQTADGRETEVWLETSDTDDRQSLGRWLEGQADIAQIAAQAAGSPVTRLTRLEIILDDLDVNGRFALDVDYLRFVSASGQTDWEESFDTRDDWTVHSTLEGIAGGGERFGFSVQQEDATTLGRLELTALVSSVLPGSIDQTTVMIEPRDGVRVLRSEAYEGTLVPILLAHERACWLNTYEPTDEAWAVLFGELLGQSLHEGVSFGAYFHAVTRDGLTSLRNTASTVIPQQSLPVDRVRLVAPPELDQPLPHTLPAGYAEMRLRVIASERDTIPYPDAGSAPPTVTLAPGEIVEFVRP